MALEAVVSEPCGAESVDSRDSLSDRNTVTDCYRINTAHLNLAQPIQEFCVASGEQQIEGERQREERLRAWSSNGRLQGLASPPRGQADPIQAVEPCLPSPFPDFITESLGSTNNRARVLVRREAAIMALTEEFNRWWCTCEPLSGEVRIYCIWISIGRFLSEKKTDSAVRRQIVQCIYRGQIM